MLTQWCLRWLAVVVMAVGVGAMFPVSAALGDGSGPQEGEAVGTIVVEIGGIGTDEVPGWPWNRLEQYLGSDISFRRFQYATCGDIDANVRRLIGYVQTLRSSRVVLAGHSMGGVLALRAIDDLGDPVQAVVLVDAPVNGLSDKLVRFGESVGIVPSCLALHQMQDPTWASLSSSVTERALSNGIKVLNVNNAYDNLVPLAAQQLPQDVNVRFDIASGTGLINHTAVFTSAAALSSIAQFVAAP